MVAGKLRTVSVVDALEEHLRGDIIGGSIAPGSRIKESPLAGELGVSRHTLRAAISRLENVGLLKYRENHGWSVPKFGQEEYEDLLLLRESYEYTAYKAVVEADLKPGEEVEQALERILAMTSEASWVERIDADCALHQSLIDLAGSPRLSRAFSSLLDEFRLCRLQSLDWLEQSPIERWKQIHVDLVAALQNGGADLLKLAGDHFSADPWNSPRHNSSDEMAVG